jgi:hypothetical protein
MCRYDLLAWKLTDMTPKTAGRLGMNMCLQLLQSEDKGASRTGIDQRHFIALADG